MAKASILRKMLTIQLALSSLEVGLLSIPDTWDLQTALNDPKLSLFLAKGKTTRPGERKL
jgi:hypothetical protein